MTTPAMTDQDRADFEAWHRSKFATKHSTGQPTRDMHNGIYAEDYWPADQQQMWEAWQAARALPQQVVAGSIDSPSLLQASVRLDEVQAMLREAGRWNGNDFDFDSKNPSEVALMDDTITDAISKLHAHIDARQAAPVCAEGMTYGDIKTWQARCDWMSNSPATVLMVEAMKAEIADLRAALVRQGAPK